MRRTLVISTLVLVVAVGGVLAYRKITGGRVQVQRGDPALTTAASIRFVERSEHPLTPEQIKRVLPLMKVLRDTDPNDVEASRALAEQIRSVFTPEQHAELEQAREEFRQRRRPGEDGRRVFGRPGGGPGGPGGFNRAEFRKQLLARVIQQLEARL